MKKHIGTIVTVVIIVLALAITGGMIASTLLGSKGDSEGTSAGYVYDVFSADSASASLLSWEKESGSVTLSLQDGAWIWTDDPEMPLDGDRVTALLSPLTSVKSSKRFTDVNEETQASFGLTEPSLRVTVTDSAYGTRTLLVGKYSAAAGGYYASLASAPGTVYVIDDTVTKNFEVTPSEMIREEVFPIITARTLDGFDLTANGNVYRFRYDARGIVSGKDTYYWYVSVNGAKSKPVETDEEALCICIIGTGYDRLVSYHEAELADYGIGEGSPVLTVHYTETVTVPGENGNEYLEQSHSYTLRFGNTDSTLCDYVSPEGTNQVYLLEAAETLAYLLSVAEACL